VVKTVPENGASDVDPNLKQIRVTFDQNMTTGRNYSWVGGGPTFPKTRGEPKWVNKRTCVLPVELEPGHEYWLSINSQKFANFRSNDGTSAVPYPISFTTAGTEEAAEQPTGEISLADVEKAATLTSEGWELWQARDYLQAADKFEQAVKIDPESSNAWNGLGWSRFNGGDSVAAEEAFGTCVKLEEAHAAAQNGLGQVYLLQRRYGKAEPHLLRAAKLQASAAWYGLTRLYLLEGKYKEALPWAKKVAAQQPEDDVARKMLAAAKAGKLDAALRAQIEPPKPSPSAALTKRGWVFFQRGMPGRAAKEFRKALKKNPNDADARNGLGFALVNTGKPAEAKVHFEACLELQSEHLGAMNGLARCLKAEGKVDEAIALWERMVEKAPGPNAGTVGLAHTHLERKEYAKAVTYFEQLVKANPEDESAKQGLKIARAGLDRKE
jgi:pentatricopeptide repeat protein